MPNTQSSSNGLDEFRCRDCKKLLAKTILRVENVNLSAENFKALLEGVRITGGAEGKCRNCKTVRRVERTYQVPVAV